VNRAHEVINEFACYFAKYSLILKIPSPAIINHTHFSDCCQVFDTNRSQCSVATFFKCGGIFNDECIANLLVESGDERTLKIGQHLVKLRAQYVCRLL